jgi:hypothetical protein
MYLPVLTGWLAAPGAPLTLITAYVTGARNELTLPPHVPVQSGDDKWELLHDQVENAVSQYGAAIRDRTFQCSGWLWIRHDDPVSRDYAKWCRARRQGLRLTRVAYGGAVTQAHGTGISGSTEVQGRVRYAQVLLRMAGVRSHVEVAGD